MDPAGDERSTTVDPVEAERAEHPDSFDPGAETGYLRRGHRDHALDVDSGAAPFDPGPGHYDDRRARRDAKKAEAGAPRPKAKLKPSERLRLADLNLQPAGRPSHEPAAPKLSSKPAHVSLRLPTLKVGAALLVVSAVAALAGSALGLPVPGLTDDSPAPATGEPGVDAATLALLDGGTPVGLSKGPYHPVVGDEIGYGEQLAKFGAPRGGRRHEGQDVFAKPGTPLVSVRDGVVVDEAVENSRYSGGRGNYVVVFSQLDGRSYVYLHLLRPALVKKGDTVKAGQPLGQVGCTGSCDGPHLHFEVRNGRQTLTAETKAVDPLPLLKEWPSVPVPAQG